MFEGLDSNQFRGREYTSATGVQFRWLPIGVVLVAGATGRRHRLERNQFEKV
jgi:hypothetical protein